jgi:hypothetical protein
MIQQRRAEICFIRVLVICGGCYSNRKEGANFLTASQQLCLRPCVTWWHLLMLLTGQPCAPVRDRTRFR